MIDTLNEQQRYVYDLLENTTESLLITGGAGTGKSYLTNTWLRNTKLKVLPVAYMGVAANNLFGGQTINRTFLLGASNIYSPKFCIDNLYDPQLVREARARAEAQNTKPDLSYCFRGEVYGLKKLLNNLDAILIDEISACRVDLLVAIDAVCKWLLNNQEKPFGGMRMIFVGDPYQLPPVVSNKMMNYHGEFKSERYVIKHMYKGVEFYHYNINYFKSIKHINLTTVERQKDAQFVKILTDIRVGRNLEQNLNLLNGLCKITTEIDEDAMVICNLNDSVTKYNQERLAALMGPTYTSVAELSKNADEKQFPFDKFLTFKKGARILMRNNDMEGRWANGTIAHILDVEVDSDNHPISVEINIDGNTYTVDRYRLYSKRMTIDENDVCSQQPDGYMEQFPFTLAYAFTVHKSQGLTFDRVHILDTGFWDNGQGYVALSRCKTTSGLSFNEPLKVRVTRAMKSGGTATGDAFKVDRPALALFGE